MKFKKLKLTPLKKWVIRFFIRNFSSFWIVLPEHLLGLVGQSTQNAELRDLKQNEATEFFLRKEN